MQANSKHAKSFHFHLYFRICKVWKGTEKNKKTWLSRERIFFFRRNKNIFHSFLMAIIWWENKNLIKIADTNFELKKKLKNPCWTFHLSTYYYMYPACKIEKKCMSAKLLMVQNCNNMAYLPQPTTGTSFGNSIYITIFLTAIWLSHGQLWVILKETASLSRC